ncbi:12786_t:CDS:2, partial [Racocetra fulgida]
MTIKEEEVIDVILPKTALVDEILEVILQKLSLPWPTYRIRLYDVINYQIINEYESTDQLDTVQENLRKLYAEEIPQDEINLNTNDSVVKVFHFTEEPLSTHGVPFKFVIKTVRLRMRLGMNENDFQRIQIAIVASGEEPHYIDYDDFEWTDELLGLDYEKPEHARRLIDTDETI